MALRVKANHASTKTIGQETKIHVGALLGKFTVPLAAIVTPMNVSDSDEFDNILTDMKREFLLIYIKQFSYLTRVIGVISGLEA